MKKIFVIILSFFLLLSVSSGVTYAKTLYQDKGTVSVAKAEVINDDLFAGGENVDLQGTVNGDVFIGAGTVNVRGKVNGNLHIGAGTVRLGGPVSGNVYIGSGEVSVQGAKIGGSLLVGTGTLTIDKESSIGGSLLVGSGTINNRAPIGRNAMLGAGMINLDSAVGGEAKLGGGKIDLGPETNIARDLTYTFDEANNFTMSEGATVGGQIKRIDAKTMPKFDQRAKGNALNKFHSAKIGWNIISFVGALIIGFLLIKLLPKAPNEVSKQIGSSFFSNIGVGFLVSVLALPALILMAITVVGLPLAAITFALLLITLYFSKLVVGLWAGNFISEKFGWKKMSFYASFTLGLLVVYLLKSLPFIGFFISLVVTLTGLGALSIYYRNRLIGK